MAELPAETTFEEIAEFLRKCWPDAVRGVLTVTHDRLWIEQERLAPKAESERGFSMRTLSGGWAA